MKVYHGSPNIFKKFDYDRIGTNGTSEGKGFYFTDKRSIAEHYGHKGYVYTVNFKGKKRLKHEKKSITRSQLKKYLVALDEETDYLSNWGDIEYEGLNNVLNEAIKGEYDYNDNDVDLICSIANACGQIDTALTLLHELFGYDSIVLDGEWGNGQKIYIALVRDIIEIVEIEEQ